MSDKNGVDGEGRRDDNEDSVAHFTLPVNNGGRGNVGQQCHREDKTAKGEWVLPTSLSLSTYREGTFDGAWGDTHCISDCPADKRFCIDRNTPFHIQSMQRRYTVVGDEAHHVCREAVRLAGSSKGTASVAYLQRFHRATLCG